MLILTILKAFAWIWGVAIIIVFIIDMVNLSSLLREGYRVNYRRYLLGTIKSLPLAPLVYPYVVDFLTSNIKDYYRKLFDKID